VAPFGDLKPGDEFVFDAGDWGALLELHGGQVIAVDQAGRAALVAHAYGKGKVLTCAWPIEQFLARVPDAYGDGDNAHRFYRALADWAGIQPLFRTDRPEVEAAALAGAGRGYVVVTNHSAVAQSVTITSRTPLRQAQRLTAEGAAAPLELHGSGFPIRLEPFDGAIVEYQESPR
jgi:hypothetical protein